jgi:biopolymer transport protein ExbD
MGTGKARIYNLISLIFVVLSLLVIIFVVAKLLGPV